MVLLDFIVFLHFLKTEFDEDLETAVRTLQEAGYDAEAQVISENFCLVQYCSSTNVKLSKCDINCLKLVSLLIISSIHSVTAIISHAL